MIVQPQVIALLLSLMFPVWTNAASLDEVVQRSRGSVVYIKVQKVSPVNGAITEIVGTGFVVNKAGFVMTSQHVIAGSGREEIDVRGALGSSEGPLEGMEVIYENSSLDVAVLRFKNTSITRMPVEIGSVWGISEAATIYAMGFPLKEEWFHTEGKLSGKNGPKGSWNTAIVLNPGMSGGPVFNVEGEVIAMVWGGSATPGINGINRIIPVNLLAEPLRLAGLVSESSPTYTPAQVPLVDDSNSTVKPSTDKGPLIIEVVYKIDQMQEASGGLQSESRDYQMTFKAHPGFRFKDYTLISKSVNNATITSTTITGDKKNLVVTFSIKSGPVFDRWRGWLDADILTRQEADTP